MERRRNNMSEITNEMFLDAMTKEEITEDMFNGLDMKQQSMLLKYNEKLFNKLNEKNVSLSDEAFLDLTSDTEAIDVEKFYNMSDKQRSIFKRMDIATYQKMNGIYDALTVEDYEKLNMNELQQLYKINPSKYNQLQAEKEELHSNRGNLLDEVQKYHRMIRARGMDDNYLNSITELTKKPIVAKYHAKFDEAVKSVLELDHLTLKKMTKEEFRNRIEQEFRSRLPLSAFNID